jgi:amino acid adenylation domain-containing protein
VSRPVEPGIRESLSPAKQALLAERLRGHGTYVDEGIGSRPRSAPALLSAGQQRLWFLHQLGGEGAAYTMFDAVRLKGPLDIRALEQCVSVVAEQHEILRTSYVERDGRPEPLVQPATSVPLTVIDLAATSSPDGESSARDVAASFVREPFDLGEGPVFRTSLLRLGPQDHVLVLAVHHIACDEWSLSLLWNEIAALYAKLRSGAPLALPAPALQYTDFAHWQHGLLREPAMQRQIEYWRRTFALPPACLELPVDHTPPEHRTFRGGFVSRPADKAVAASLRQLARRTGVTPFVLHLAAFATQLRLIADETDLVIGVPVTGRSRPALEAIVGFFLNTLPLRLDLAGKPAFTDVVAAVNAVVLDAMTHQDAPFETIVDAVAPARQPGRNPLFQVMFVEQQHAKPVSFGDDLAASRFTIESGASKFDLTLFVAHSLDTLETGFEYDADRFDRSTAERLLDCLHTLLTAIAAHPDRPITALPILSAEARAHVLTRFSCGQPADPPATLVHSRFETCADRAPDAAAVVAETGVLSYGELRQRAEVIAARLREAGVGPGEHVVLCANRSPDMIAGILGVLMAGASYVPLDPAYPEPRLRFTLDDVAARIVLTTSACADRFRDRDVLVHLLEDDPGAAGPPIGERPAVSLSDPAYVIHTSGSTGKPKGVIVTHGNLAYSTGARSQVYPEPPGVFLLLPSFAFDSSVAGIFWTLTTGGSLALPPARAEQDVAGLAAFVARYGVTHVLCLPALWSAILEHAPVAQLRSLRTVIVAGEACPLSLVRRHDRALPDAALWNEYGPTEATVWSTAFPIPRGFARTRVPIGRPIPGARAYVLDPAGQPVPVGIAGELFIGGRGVTAGYLNQPEETAARFTADPFTGEPGARLYRTGDRVRWRADGQLEFLGRVDQQLKIRGFRVEPGEIESVLAMHPAVLESHVLAREMPASSASEEASIDVLVSALTGLDEAEQERMLAAVERPDPGEVVL